MAIIKQLLKHYFYLIIIFSIGRVSLFVWQFGRFSQTPDYWLTFVYGIKMDTILALMLLLPLLFLLTLAPKILAKFIDKLMVYYFLLILILVIFIESATFPFFIQYDIRPNYLFVEYLEHIREVSSMLMADYKTIFVVTLIVIYAVARAYLKQAQQQFLYCFDVSYIKRIALLLPLLLIFSIGIRSSFGHRPANISDALYSSNRILNEVTKNSLYSILYAVYSSNKHDGDAKRYGSMKIDHAIQRVKRRLNIQNTHPEYIFNRVVNTHFKHAKDKNLVIFIQESIGAQFVAAVGGESGITPYFNQLANQGLLFTDAYSNGTRSIRGLAGLVAGNFSVPGKGVLKRNKSQQDFFTVASLLKSYQYETMFLYGGESRFDNMKSWFSGNGFDRIIEQNDFINPNYVGSWGVSDEDLVIRANQEFKKYYRNHQKFAAVMFSTSNHTPFDFPEDKIDLVKGVAVKSVKNAIKYADYALGQFIKLAQNEDYYKDTIFVIVANHDVRVYGDDLVPVNHFHIPALILGQNVPITTYDKISTQPDILATVLDLMGIKGLHYPIHGHSIFSDKKQNIALMQFNDSYALRQDNKVAIIRPNKEPLTFFYQNEKLNATTHDKQLEQDALAFVITLNHLYSNKLHQ
ncbi:Phosphoglycerol transferase I [Bathymodiolus heckerae thiotrophic gill symbiont]|uniref:LTA synthase family protein n=1 Tax=Bathymodiolus heckerae thiotrophic gill symbiont TaxID=1052212 RepID=UPI0010B7104D|nr:LTA synthase family protein [Bathymodiolus heckerae thiotrophic gill symbiont]SMN13425.1 Phosphoglycerol transferase I [Bathymodiolus heckerae thiotrophic gill symbiont]